MSEERREGGRRNGETVRLSWFGSAYLGLRVAGLTPPSNGESGPGRPPFRWRCSRLRLRSEVGHERAPLAPGAYVAHGQPGVAEAMRDKTADSTARNGSRGNSNAGDPDVGVQLAVGPRRFGCRTKSSSIMSLRRNPVVWYIFKTPRGL